MSALPLPAWRLIAFAAPGFATSVVGAAAAGVLPTLYATHFGVSLGFLGLVLLLSRVLDAVLDPIVGYLSDHTRGPLGRRRVWIVAGCLIFVAASWALLRPPGRPSEFYVLLAYLAFYFSWAMIEIPHAAWAAELAQDVAGRTRVMTYKHIVSSLGGIAFALAPLVPGVGTGEITLEVLAAIGLATLVAAPLLTWICAVAVPDPPAPAGSRLVSPLKVLNDVRRNGPFLRFVAIFLVSGIGYGLYSGLYFLYVQTYLRIGDAISIILVIMVASTFVALPVWMRIIPRIGKRRAWAFALVSVGAISVAMTLIAPGPDARWQFITLLSLMGLVSGANTIVPYAMLADVVDWDTLRSGENRAGSYFALLMLILKVNLAAGAGIGLVLLQVAGYDPTATVHDPGSILALKLCTFIGPSMMMTVSAWWVLRFPLSEARHALILRRLERRQARAVP